MDAAMTETMETVDVTAETVIVDVTIADTMTVDVTTAGTMIADVTAGITTAITVEEMMTVDADRNHVLKQDLLCSIRLPVVDVRNHQETAVIVKDERYF